MIWVIKPTVRVIAIILPDTLANVLALLLTDFVCLYTYEFWLSLWKIVQSSVVLLLPLFMDCHKTSFNDKTKFFGIGNQNNSIFMT